MVRYFKAVEVDQATFVNATGEDLGHYIQSIIPVGREVFVAVDDDYEVEFSVSLECFEEECVDNA